MPDFNEISKWTEGQAREYLEHLRWPTGVACVHCGSVNVAKLQGKATRPGVFKCRDCRKQFTVTVGTIFEDSHIPLQKWIMAFHLMCASKKGISALQLMRMLDLKGYKSAWHLAHRVRHAMNNEPLKTMLGAGGGIVEADETWVGPRHKRPRGHNYWQDNKTPVIALVERDGSVRTRVVEKVTAETLRSAIADCVSQDAELHTDGYGAYRTIGRSYRKHESVDHTAGEYARGSVHVNSAECFFGLLKRGLAGSFHHVGKRHLPRYCNEFSFRWNHRKVTDSERTEAAIKLAPGCRLTYKQPKAGAQ